MPTEESGVIYFRCAGCAAVVRAEDDRAGQLVPCPRCARVTACPEKAAAHPALVSRARTTDSQPGRGATSPAVWWMAGACALAATGWAGWALAGSDAHAVRSLVVESAVDVRQRDILAQAIDRPGEPSLVRAFQELNLRHFGGRLPAMAVQWEPRLAEVGALADQAFTLDGMFGDIDGREVILISDRLRGNQAALRRTLSHEMVHALLHARGEDSSAHGPAFQAELRRLSGEGAFEGVAATAAERTSLKAWLDEESSRLESDQADLAREGAAIEQERAALDEAIAEMQARLARAGSSVAQQELDTLDVRREAHNRHVETVNARLARGRADLAEFNRQLDRYNLMLVYPDGLVATEMVSVLPVLPE